MDRIINKIGPSVPDLPTKKRVAAYARVSSGKDAMLHSLSSQVSYYSKLIQRNTDWEYAGVYVDEAMTGTKSSRKGFQQLLNNCRNGLVDMVITKSISRFARNTVTLLESVRELKRHNVDVYFERENIHSISGDGELMLTILASFAQEESLSASENCKWRIRNNFKEGRPNTLHIYGYDYVNYGLVINPAEAEVIRMIYTDYLNGGGINAITQKLIELNVSAKDGGKWSESVIKRILRNEKYVGNMLLQKTYSENHLTKAKRINKGELPMYYVEGSHEAIIEQSVFDEVQKEIERRASRFAPKSKRSFSEFTGKIHCDICGANFRRKINSAGTKYAKPVWSCTTYNTRGKQYCASMQIPENILLETAANVLGLAEYDKTVFEQKILEIRVPENGTLIFIFKNKNEVLQTWKHKSRRDSWTDEMREHARQVALGSKRSDA